MEVYTSFQAFSARNAHQPERSRRRVMTKPLDSMAAATSSARVSIIPEKRGEILEASVIGDADAGDDGYVTVSEMLSDPVVKSPTCPLCKRLMRSEGRILHTKGQKYTAPFKCPMDGEMLLTLKLHRNFNDTWRAKRTVQPMTDDLRAQYELGLERNTTRRKADTKRRPRRGRKPRATESAQTATAGNTADITN